jgi:hypothetical protein
MLCSPTHVFTHPQWWSKRGIHLHMDGAQMAATGPNTGLGKMQGCWGLVDMLPERALLVTDACMPS